MLLERSVLLFLASLVSIFCLLSVADAQPPNPPQPSPYSRWTNGPPADANYFPIGVWLQSPNNAARYKAAGINLYVALWRGPTDDQLVLLQKAGMRLICSQNQAGLKNLKNPTIIGWMHGDEPDNAQSLGQGKGYGPPILPETIQRDCERICAADPSRPVMLNLGQGVAWDNYIGRGVRRNHPEDYREYAKGCDLVSFDIYPVVHDSPTVAGKLEYVARGVERLREWTDQAKPVWNCIECTHISNPQAKATPAQVRSEVWMALIHGSHGLIYFVHQFKPTFKEAALLDDADMLAAVTEINHQIRELAPVLNSPTIANGATVDSSAPEAQIALMVKRHENATYLFAANMRNHSTRGAFKLRELRETAPAEVLGESRAVALRSGEFADEFKPYDVHLYRVSLNR